MATNDSIAKVLSEDEIKEVARQMLEPGYNAGIQALDQGLESYLAGVGNAQQTAERRVTDSAIKRGMGRSSRTTYEMSEALGDIAEQVGLYTQQVEAQKNRLTSDYEQNVLNQIYQLRQQEREQYRWQQEYDLALRNSRRGGGGGGTTPRLTPTDIFINDFNNANKGAGTGLTKDLKIVGPYSTTKKTYFNDNRPGAGALRTKMGKIVGPYG